MAGQVEEFVPGGDGVVEAAEHGGGHHAGILFFNAAHHHAQVPGFDDDADALGLEGVHDRAGDLVGQAFLELQAPGVHVGQAGEFADPQHLAPGNVAEAISSARPAAVDVSSGVEQSPGRKDLERVAAFIDAVSSCGEYLRIGQRDKFVF